MDDIKIYGRYGKDKYFKLSIKIAKKSKKLKYHKKMAEKREKIS